MPAGRPRRSGDQRLMFEMHRRIAVKFDTPRACVPSRTLMAQATAVPAALLSATEMDILVGLRFDVLNGSIVSRG